MRALLLVDLQNDFMPDGSLPVPGGREIIPLANQLIKTFEHVLATQDWHPADHLSFASNHQGKKPGEQIDLDGLDQILWPDHCVQGSAGAGFVEGLEMGTVEKIIQKGTDQRIDSYSGFFDNGHKKSTGLDLYLKGRGISELFVLGVATDYCVRFSVLDALKCGIRTTLVEDACRGVNLNATDSQDAIAEMKAAGAEIINSGKLQSV